MRSSIIVISVFLAAAMAAPARAADDPVASLGSILAKGTGQVWVFGNGEAEFKMDGSGKLVVKNMLANRIVVRGSGSRVAGNNEVTYLAHRGRVTVKGATMSAHFSGGSVEVRAQGSGRVVFAGKGQFWLDDQTAAKDWGEYGTIVAMGNGADDALDAQAEDALYDRQTVRAVADIRTFPYYSHWSLRYPEAALVLGGTRNYYDWYSRYPTAALSLYAYPTWGIWLDSRCGLLFFLGYHGSYISWYASYPWFGSYFSHPYSYYRWHRRHRDAHDGARHYRSYGDWARRYPSAARSLGRRGRGRSSSTFHSTVSSRRSSGLTTSHVFARTGLPSTSRVLRTRGVGTRSIGTRTVGTRGIRTRSAGTTGVVGSSKVRTRTSPSTRIGATTTRRIRPFRSRAAYRSRALSGPSSVGTIGRSVSTTSRSVGTTSRSVGIPSSRWGGSSTGSSRSSISRGSFTSRRSSGGRSSGSSRSGRSSGRSGGRGGRGGRR